MVCLCGVQFSVVVLADGHTLTSTAVLRRSQFEIILPTRRPTAFGSRRPRLRPFAEFSSSLSSPNVEHVGQSPSHQMLVTCGI